MVFLDMFMALVCICTYIYMCCLQIYMCVCTSHLHYLGLYACLRAQIALHEVAAEVQEKEYDVDYSLLTLRKIASSQHFR